MHNMLIYFFVPASPHFADQAVLHVGLLVASLLAHQSNLQLTERLGQDVTLREELPPLHDVGLQQRRVVLVTQHSLRNGEKHKTGLIKPCGIMSSDTKPEEQFIFFPPCKSATASVTRLLCKNMVVVLLLVLV